MTKGVKARSRVTAQGQGSVPVRFRESLGFSGRSLLQWDADDARVVVRRAGKNTSADIHEAVFGLKKPATRSLEQLTEGIRRYVGVHRARD